MANIEIQMSKIFGEAQKQLLEEFFLAIEKWKNVTYLQTRLNVIINEVQTKYWLFQTAISQEEYLYWWKYYNKEIVKEVNKIKTLPIAERLSSGGELILGLWEVNTVAVSNLIASGNSYLAETMQWIKKWIIWQFNEYQLAKTFEKIWTGMIKWEATNTMKSNLVKSWQKNFPFFKDKAWRKWTLERYGDMLIRTEMTKAYNMWTLTQGTQLWIKKYKRIEYASCCVICKPHRNEVWDIKNGFPPLMFHPNCRWYREPILILKPRIK